MGSKVRKTLNIDAEKLTRAREFLGLDTVSEVIDVLLDRLLDECDFEQELAVLFRDAPATVRNFGSPLVVRRQRRLGW